MIINHKISKLPSGCDNLHTLCKTEYTVGSTDSIYYLG